MARMLKFTRKIDSERNLTLRKVNKLFNSKIDEHNVPSDAEWAKIQRGVREATLKCIREAHNSVVREMSFGGGKNKGEFKAYNGITVHWQSMEEEAPGLINYYAKVKGIVVGPNEYQDSKTDPSQVYKYLINKIENHIYMA